MPLISEMLTRWDAIQFAVIRYLMAATALMALLAVVDRAGFVAGGIAFHRVLILGLTQTGFGILYTLGIGFSNPITAAIISATSPVTMALTARIGFGVKLNPDLLPAIALAITGASLSLVKVAEGGLTLAFVGGEPLILVAHSSWATYSMLNQRWLAGHSQLYQTTVGAISSALVITAVWIAFAAIGLSRFEAPPLEPGDGFILLWTSVGAISLGVVFWNYGVRHLGFVVAAFFPNMIPAVAMVTAAVLGTYPTTQQIIGAVLVVSGILYSQKATILSVFRKSEPAG